MHSLPRSMTIVCIDIFEKILGEGRKSNRQHPFSSGIIMTLGLE